MPGDPLHWAFVALFVVLSVAGWIFVAWARWDEREDRKQREANYRAWERELDHHIRGNR